MEKLDSKNLTYCENSHIVCEKCKNFQQEITLPQLLKIKKIQERSNWVGLKGQCNDLKDAVYEGSCPCETEKYRYIHAKNN